MSNSFHDFHNPISTLASSLTIWEHLSGTIHIERLPIGLSTALLVGARVDRRESMIGYKAVRISLVG